MKFFNVLLSISLASIVSITTANAEGYYLGAGFGYNSLSSNYFEDYTANLISQNGGSNTASLTKSVANLRLIGGIKINKQISTELGYFRSGNLGSSYVGTTSNNSVYSSDWTSTISGFDVSAILRPSTLPKLNNYFINIGMHHYGIHGSGFHTSGTFVDNIQEKWSGTGPLLGGGYDLKLNKFVDLRFNFTRYFKVGGVHEDNMNNFSISLIENY